MTSATAHAFIEIHNKTDTSHFAFTVYSDQTIATARAFVIKMYQTITMQFAFHLFSIQTMANAYVKPTFHN